MSSDRSLSARRAWIEIEVPHNKDGRNNVALRKESVDRNSLGLWIEIVISGRSPQGERG